jgi:imidazole glycerol-phosphate synthase subunit HisF
VLKKRCYPTLLLANNGFVKTKRFKHARYIGDPINTCRVFDEFEVDEVCVYGIDAFYSGINFNTLGILSSMLSVPLTYGGGIQNLAQAKCLIQSGIERVSFNSAYFDNPDLIKNIAHQFGAQSVVLTLDIIIHENSSYLFDYRNKKIRCENLFTTLESIDYRLVGEIIYNFVDRDGTRIGPDLMRAKELLNHADITKSIAGGVASINDIKELFQLGYDGVGVGADFVYANKNDSVVLHYPRSELDEMLEKL